MKLKRKLIPLTSMFVVVVLLATAVGALAAQDPGDETFTLVGPITPGLVVGTYVVKGQTFSLDAPVCVPVAPCPPASNTLVEVTGYVHAADTLYYATSITVITSTDSFDYTGELMSTSTTAWDIGDYSFLVSPTTELPAVFDIGDIVTASYTVAPNGDYLATKIVVTDSTVERTYVGILGVFDANTWTVDGIVFDVTGATVPPFFATGDEVQVVYTIVAGKNVASALSVLNSAGEYTYEGELTAFTATEWTVGDYTFTLGAGVVLPPFFGLHDTVKVTFSIVDGEMVASAVEVTETFVPNKVESARCENRLKDHPAVVKLANELGEDPVKLTEYFCKGFGVGEIKQAFKYASGDYTPAMLLAMRANGMSWGEIKHLMAGQSSGASENQDKSGGNGKDKHQEQDQEQTQTQTQTQSQSQDHTNNGKGPDPDKGNSGNNGNGNGKGKNK